MGWVPCFTNFLQNTADENTTASDWIAFLEGLAMTALVQHEKELKTMAIGTLQ